MRGPMDYSDWLLCIVCGLFVAASFGRREEHTRVMERLSVIEQAISGSVCPP